MTLKEHHKQPIGGFTFYFEAPSGEVVQLTGASISNLTRKVNSNFLNLGMNVPENLAAIIEHQICLRQPNPVASCWSGGLGDTLHHKWIKPFISRASDAVKALTGYSGLEAVSNCQTCSGTKVYKAGANNLGRAGTLNKIGK